MRYGFGRRGGFGRGSGGSMGFGFRGSSPPWPYIGRGRGGLPRGSYYFGSTRAPAWSYKQPFYSEAYAPAYPSYAHQMSREEELNYLRDQSEAIKGQLGKIESRINDLEANKQESQ